VVFLGVSSVAGGVLFPASILPDWLQIVARLNPVTYALDAMRASLLGGAGVQRFGALSPSCFSLRRALAALDERLCWSLRRTKITGTLTHS